MHCLLEFIMETVIRQSAFKTSYYKQSYVIEKYSLPPWLLKIQKLSSVNVSYPLLPWTILREVKIICQLLVFRNIINISNQNSTKINKIRAILNLKHCCSDPLKRTFSGSSRNQFLEQDPPDPRSGSASPNQDLYV